MYQSQSLQQTKKMSCELFALPTDLLKIVFAQWCSLRDIVRFDSVHFVFYFMFYILLTLPFPPLSSVVRYRNRRPW